MQALLALLFFLKGGFDLGQDVLDVGGFAGVLEYARE